MKLSNSVLRHSTWLALGLAAAAATVNGQSLVDLKNQSKNVDFSGAGATKPMKTGTVLPSTCGTGELFFQIGAAAGRNTYGCTAANTWTLQGGGGSGGAGLPDPASHAGQVLTTDGTNPLWLPLGGDVSGPSNSTQVGRLQGRVLAATAPADGQVLTWSQSSGQWQPQTSAAGSGGGGQFTALGVTFTSSTTLTLAAGCSAASPCNVRFGNTVYSVTSSSTAVLQSGNGSSWIYMTSAGILTIGSTMTLSCSPGCTAAAGITGFPRNVVPLYIWNATPVGWDPNGGTDLRAPLSAKLVTSGLGLTIVDTGLQSTISVDAASVPGYVPGTATLSFPTVAPASCSSELTISTPGANPGDPVAPGWPATLPANLMGMMRVKTADTVSVKLCNPTSAPVAVPSDVFSAAIIHAL